MEQLFNREKLRSQIVSELRRLLNSEDPHDRKRLARFRKIYGLSAKELESLLKA